MTLLLKKYATTVLIIITVHLILFLLCLLLLPTSGRRSTSPECTYVFMTENFWRRYSREKLRRSVAVSGVCSGIFLCASHAIIYEQFCATSMVKRSVHDLKLCSCLCPTLSPSPRSYYFLTHRTTDPQARCDDRDRFQG